MPRGLPASYIKKAKRELGEGASFSRIFKRAWQLYKGSKVYKALKGENPHKKSKTKKGGSRKVTKKKRSYRRKITIPMAAVGGALAGVFIEPRSGVGTPFGEIMNGNIDRAFRILIENYTGFQPTTGQWNIMNAKGLHAAIIGIVAHKVASWLGVNRALGRAKIPLIRI